MFARFTNLYNCVTHGNYQVFFTAFSFVVYILYYMLITLFCDLQNYINVLVTFVVCATEYKTWAHV